MTERAVELLCRLISVPRISREETAAADLLQDYMSAELGLSVKRDGNNLWSVAPCFDPEKQTLLLNAHIDTVKPVAGWQRDPFAPTREGDRIYGLGSNDDGASLVALLHVFAALKDKPTCYNLVFLASAEEEVSGKGGVEHVLPLLPKIDVALVGEPTGMQPAIAEKGLLVLDVTAKGKAGHAARDEGDNAIYKAIQDIQWLAAYRFPKLSETLGPVILSVTMVSAGTQHNVVPDECRYVVDVRLNEHYTHQEVLDELKRHLQAELTPRSMRLRPSGIGMDHPFVRACQAKGIECFGSSTLSDQALMPFASVKIGPGDSARSHTAGEFVRVSEIDEAVELYVTLLDGLRLA